MKKLIPVVMILMSASAAQAGGLVSSHSSSVQLTVDSARSTATRVGNSYSISGTNVGTSDGTTAGMLSAGTITSGIYSPGTISASQLSATNGEAFSFSTAFTQGDVIPTSAVTVGDVAAFGNITSTSAGSAGSLAGTLATTGAITLTAGGAGTNATGQFVSELSILH